MLPPPRVPQILPPPRRVLPGDVRTIAAWTALVAALSGAIELRVKVGSIAERVDRIEKKLEGAPQYARFAAD
jgi:hypothetical protein